MEPGSIGWIGSDEVGRCRRCACDLRKTGADWRRLPPGLKLVLRSPLPPDRDWGDEGLVTGAARQVDLHGVTVVGERTYGSRRYALVVLDESDKRGFIAASPEARKSTDLFADDANDSFEWENTYARP